MIMLIKLVGTSIVLKSKEEYLWVHLKLIKVYF